MNKEMMKNAFAALAEKEAEEARERNLCTTRTHVINVVKDMIEEFVALDIMTHLGDCGINKENANKVANELHRVKKFMENSTLEDRQLLYIACNVVEGFSYENGLQMVCSDIYQNAVFYDNFLKEIQKSEDPEEIKDLQKECIDKAIPEFFKDLEDVIEMGANHYHGV